MEAEIEPRENEWRVVRRPTEVMVFAHLLGGAPYPFDSYTIASRYSTEFTAHDWLLFLMLMHFKNRVIFGHDLSSQMELRGALEAIGSPACLGIDYYELLIRHAELLTKITRRRNAGLVDVPDAPYWIKQSAKVIIERMKAELVAG